MALSHPYLSRGLTKTGVLGPREKLQMASKGADYLNTDTVAIWSRDDSSSLPDTLPNEKVAFRFCPDCLSSCLRLGCTEQDPRLLSSAQIIAQRKHKLLHGKRNIANLSNSKNTRESLLRSSTDLKQNPPHCTKLETKPNRRENGNRNWTLDSANRVSIVETRNKGNIVGDKLLTLNSQNNTNLNSQKKSKLDRVNTQNLKSNLNNENTGSSKSNLNNVNTQNSKSNLNKVNTQNSKSNITENNVYTPNNVYTENKVYAENNVYIANTALINECTKNKRAPFKSVGVHGKALDNIPSPQQTSSKQPTPIYSTSYKREDFHIKHKTVSSETIPTEIHGRIEYAIEHCISMEDLSYICPQFPENMDQFPKQPQKKSQTSPPSFWPHSYYHPKNELHPAASPANNLKKNHITKFRQKNTTQKYNTQNYLHKNNTQNPTTTPDHTNPDWEAIENAIGLFMRSRQR